MSLANSLESISIVLVKTSHPGNVGSVARAMKTMGLSDLRLVSPKFPDIAKHDEAISLASGAADVLERVQVYESLPQAMHDCHRSYALSARLRELGPSLQTPRQAAGETCQAIGQGVKVAYVFGAERTGLSNEELQQCNRQVMIPANPAYSSLNLSQAVQIVCYALRTAFTDAEGGAVGQVEVSDLATAQSVADLQAHWLRAMESVDFLNPDKPKKIIQRLTRLLSKTEFEKVEVDMLRGFFADVIRVSEGRLYPHEAQRLRAAEKPGDD